MPKRPRPEDTIPPRPLDETLRLACIREHGRLVAATPDFTAFLACLSSSTPRTLLIILRRQSLKLAGGRVDRLARIATHVMQSSRWPCWRRLNQSEAGDAIKVRHAELATPLLSKLTTQELRSPLLSFGKRSPWPLLSLSCELLVRHPELPVWYALIHSLTTTFWHDRASLGDLRLSRENIFSSSLRAIPEAWEGTWSVALCSPLAHLMLDAESMCSLSLTSRFWLREVDGWCYSDVLRSCHPANTQVKPRLQNWALLLTPTRRAALADYLQFPMEVVDMFLEHPDSKLLLARVVGMLSTTFDSSTSRPCHLNSRRMMAETVGISPDDLCGVLALCNLCGNIMKAAYRSLGKGRRRAEQPHLLPLKFMSSLSRSASSLVNSQKETATRDHL